jgi:hypothetical protein
MAIMNTGDAKALLNDWIRTLIVGKLNSDPPNLSFLDHFWRK